MLITLIILSIFIITNRWKKTSDVQGTNEVLIQGIAFSPSTITFPTGTSFSWTNKDVIAHTFTSITYLFDCGSISTNGTCNHTFNAVGTYPYLAQYIP
ncbi:MAG: hypothetical protein ABSF81_13825 [Bacteroidales bacterium]